MPSERALLPILFRDEHLVAIDKPAGLLVHRTALDRHERRFALQMLRDQIGCHVYASHRLDRGTSGVLLFARSSEVAQSLGTMFAERRIGKRYLAVVRGHPPPQGEIDHPLRRCFGDDENSGESAVPTIQQAVTHYRRLASIELPHAVDPYPQSRYALLELTPLTGRRHQLRRHLKHIAHPIIGDTTYGKAAHNHLFRALLGCQRMLLTCTELRFAHPVSGEPLRVIAPLAGEFLRLVERCQWAAALPPQWLPAGVATADG
ncbi:MAG: pseudouridine synthase [Accumulibacter sp.]